jgi:hypothetical protein
MSIQEAFFGVCREAKPAEGCYVSLYCRAPYYGGPEEGGWWGQDVILVAYQWFSTQEAAEAARAEVERLAEKLRREARKGFGEQCLREMEWLEARGLDADYLPEVDGEEDYFVTFEETAGSCQSQGCRHYE